MFDKIKLGKRIKSLRTRKGFTQDKLAELAGLNGKYLGEVERGKENISIVNLMRIAEALDAPMVSIVDCDHERESGELKSQLHRLIDEADEKELKIVYRLIETVLR